MEASTWVVVTGQFAAAASDRQRKWGQEPCALNFLSEGLIVVCHGDSEFSLFLTAALAFIHPTAFRLHQPIFFCHTVDTRFLSTEGTTERMTGAHTVMPPPNTTAHDGLSQGGGIQTRLF